MSEIQRVELPGLLAQSEQVARLGGGRSRPGEVVQRAELDQRLAAEARRRDEEVRAAEAIPAIEREPRGHDGEPGRRRRRQASPDQAAPADEVGETPEPPHVDVTA